MKIEEIKTPAYVYDIDAFRKNVTDINSIIKSNYPNFRLGYSYKTNYLPQFIEVAKELKLYAEIVSKQEFEMVKAIGERDENIIYNGVIEDFWNKVLVASSGGIVNIENMTELKQFVEYTNNARRTLEI